MTTRRNYENTDIEIGSFFNYTRGDFVTNAVVMNPPFSIEFKSLTDEEKEIYKRNLIGKRAEK